ncbi:MAG: chorismate mutase [Candidatus Muproteobacteria bacterium RBG_16_62_13]|uniref:Bifunctional chorismate mutase/prephenate dehydratase n=1 Tax=Candidatus Muproteobacteria bacterium RBG_16_62_13 TaxID=1817756 RepID=A0A1F6T7W9_9PROT|nr:MAG: chorismate mutase [Candidatus Muproteobacteria bacterium RBG_16_62_13]
MARRRQNAGLARTRRAIDTLDDEILKLLTRRAEHAQAIARHKQGDPGGSVYRPEREAQILRKVRTRNRGPLRNDNLTRIYREIVSSCRALEQDLSVAYLGPSGTFTEEAALKHFGHAVRTRPLAAIDEVFREVESGNASYGVVPVENSTEGVINHTLDMFMASPLKICGEIELPIHHHLLARQARPRKAKRVVSHQQSLAQCREWLDANLPGIDRQAVSSNAEAARLASRDATLLAIAGETAAQRYGLTSLAANIEDQPDNTTRFLVIGPHSAEPSGHDKTSLLLSGRNRPGSLSRLLAPLARRGINMTRIESRPSRASRWEYVFFIDLDGHAKDRKLKLALADLEKEAAFMKWLGSYPRAIG